MEFLVEHCNWPICTKFAVLWWQVRYIFLTKRENRKTRFPVFNLECKQATISNTWVRYRHICSLFFDVVAISVEAVIIAVDQRVKALVVK
jgi:hypothetical protein